MTQKCQILSSSVNKLYKNFYNFEKYDTNQSNFIDYLKHLE